MLVDAFSSTPKIAKHRAKMLAKAAAVDGAEAAAVEEAEVAGADARFLTACSNLPLVRVCEPAAPSRGIFFCSKAARGLYYTPLRPGSRVRLSIVCLCVCLRTYSFFFFPFC